MPHVVIEYSKNAGEEISSSGILQLLHDTMNTSELFSPDAIKTRSYPANDFLVGIKGSAGKFVHVSVSILTGRTVEQRQVLSQSLIEVLQKTLDGFDSLTVNIIEMDKEIYRKVSTT